MMHWFGNYGMGMGMGFGWIVMIIFWCIIILLAMSIWKRNNADGQETAAEILKKRYARGELSREEFARMKKEINE